MHVMGNNPCMSIWEMIKALFYFFETIRVLLLLYMHTHSFTWLRCTNSVLFGFRSLRPVDQMTCNGLYESWEAIIYTCFSTYEMAIKSKIWLE